MNREDSFSTLPRFVKIKSLNKSDKEDYFLSLIALAQFPLVFVQLLLISFGWAPESTTIYRVILSAGTILLAIPVILKRKGGSFIGFYFFVCILYLIHYFIFPSTIEYWHDNGFRFLIPICIPTLFCVLSIKNLECFYIALKHICYITALCCTVFGLRLLTGGYDTEDTYFMNFGFLLLLPVIVLFLENTWYSILLSILFFLLIVVFGSRGPLISVAAFTGYYIVRKKEYILLIVIAILFVAGYSAFSSYLDSMGISSRTIQMFLSGDMMDETGRGEIRNILLKGINENPIIGNGLFGDRALTKGYAHNFFLEVICDFGYVFGGILLLWLLYEIVYVTFYLRGYHKDIFVAMLCVLFLPLMTSGSYLQEPNFFIFIGLLVIMKKQIRRNKLKVTHNLGIVKA